MRAGIGILSVVLALAPACAGDDGGTGGDDGTSDDGGEGEPSDPVAICDGGDGLRLAARFADGGLGSPATSIPGANGGAFLYVDGACRAWVSGVAGQALSLTMSPDEADELSERLGVSAWQDFAGGEWSGDGYNAPALTLWQPSGQILCQRGCVGGDLPEPLSLVGAALLEEIDRLASTAEPLDGPMRVMAIPGFQSPVPAFAWSYEPPISSFADPGGPDTGVVPGLVESPAATVAVRAAWLDAQLSGSDAQVTGSVPLPVVDATGNQLTYALFARDVLPFEKADAWGGVELP